MATASVPSDHEARSSAGAARERGDDGPAARTPTSIARWWTQPVLLATLALAVGVAIAQPFGPFSVDDEWAYLRSLQHLHQDGIVRILDWNPMSLVAHLWWGELFLRLFGDSVSVARASTIVLFVVELFAVDAILRHVHVPRGTRVVALLALVCNPIQFYHGLLYFTDVPATTWMVLAVLCAVVALDGAPQHGGRLLVLASLFAGLSFLVRQSGALVWIALLVHLALFERARLRQPVTLFAAILLPGAIGLAFEYWYLRVHGPTAAYLSSQAGLRQALARAQLMHAIPFAGVAALYLGFFTAPLTIALGPRIARTLDTRRRTILLGSVVTLVAFVAAAASLRAALFPYIPNTLTPFGLLGINEFIVGARPVVWPAAAMWMATAACVAGTAGLLASGLAWLACRTPLSDHPTRPRPATAACVSLCTILLGLQIVYANVTRAFLFDRHLIALLPFALIVAAVWARDARIARTPAALVLAVMAWYAVAGSHDVYALSREAFEAGNDLIRQGIDPSRIVGGYAFDGWYMYERSRQLPRHVRTPSRADVWWRATLDLAIEPEYVLSLSPASRIDREAFSRVYRRWVLPFDDRGFEPLTRRSFATYWPPGTAYLYVLHERGPVTLPPPSRASARAPQ